VKPDDTIRIIPFTTERIKPIKKEETKKTASKKPNIKTIAFIPPKSVDDDHADNTIPPVDSLLTHRISYINNTHGNDIGTIIVPNDPPGNCTDCGNSTPPETLLTSNIITDHPPVVSPDVSPSFPGGMKALMRYLGEEIRYPERASKVDIAGKVFVRFVVEKDGSIADLKVLRGIGFGCDEEALRVLSGMPKWTPGSVKGNPVRSYFNIPISFVIE
ncbi:MAG: TonB family protein, partial [Leadbetterella sp.]